MALIEQLELANFRSYAAGRFRFSSSRVVFTGPNGAGKTNLLESIYFLSILRSFRTVSGRELVRIGERGFELKARVDKGAYHEELRLAQTLAGKRETWIGANRIRRSSEFIREFRAVVFVPEDRNISGGSSSFRRRFFDMMISTLDGGYLTALNNYYRALSQRNRALKQKEQAAVAAAFEPEMAVNAPLIARQRRIYAKLIEEEVSRMLAEDGNLEFRIVCRTDYPENAAEYREMLERNRPKEQLRSCTLSGPQLDEFDFLLNGKLLRYYGSTGQIRIISLLLKLAEFNLVKRAAKEPVAVLVDDVTGELDELNKARFFRTISGADQQFFTFTELPELEIFRDAEEIKIKKNEK